jgi:PAS domain S-box-containing protein
LNYPAPKAKQGIDTWKKTVAPKYEEQTYRLIESCLKNPSENFDSDFQYKDFNDQPVVLRGTGITVNNDDGSVKGLVIKYRKRGKGNSEHPHLLKKIKKFKKLIGIYEETNEIARIGGWEVNLVKGTVTWTKVTKDIHEVEEDFRPDLAGGINFYKEGYNRDLITKLFNDAVEKGIPFDAEFKLITAKGKEIWVRSFGKPEFENDKCVRIYGAFQDIDAKKKQELEFKDTKERFEKIFTNSSIGILLINRNNKLLMANPASLKIFGLTDVKKERVLDLAYKDMIHPDYLEEANALRKKLLSGELDRYKMESRFITAKGKTIWCTVNTSIIYGQDGSDDLIITQVEDITDRKNLERSALENSQKFINAFEYSANGMGVIDLDGNWLMVNKNLSQMIGYSKKELLKLRFRDIIHPKDLSNDTQLLGELINKQRESYSIQKRYIHKNGKIVYGYLNASALTDENGNITSLIGQVTDMTESIRSQRALKRTLNDLQNLLAATTQVSIIETDLKGIARKFNRGAENLLGYKAEEVIGHLNVGVLHDGDEVARRGLELSKKYNEEIAGFDVFTYKAKLGAFDSREWTYIRKDGSRFPVQLVVTSIKNQKGKITGYLGVATNISKLKEMEASLVSSKLKAEAANKSKSEFLANMSHEIRTPLNGIIGFTDLLMKTKLSDSQEKYMYTVYNSANSLLDLLNDILDFSKIEAGKLEINEERTDLVKLCGQTIDIINHQAQVKGLRVLLNIPSDTNRFIHADGIRLRQILTNLLGNAVKFTEMGEIELKIRTEPSPNNENESVYEFSIRDTGIGIAPDNLKKIFFAFDQEDGSTTRKYGGTGLGLTISNKLLQLMGSKLQVKSKIGFGSTFSFKVSFKIGNQKNHRANTSKTIKNVLVIDDNENDRTILKEMLAIDKIDSTLLSNGIDAIELLEKENPFDLAIIDYHMPYLNGLDLIKHLRKKLALDSDDLPIILLYSSGEDRGINRACKDLDVRSSVVKPIQIHKLFELMDNIRGPKAKDVQDRPITEAIDLSMSTFNILVAEDNPVNKYLLRTIINSILPNAAIIEANDGLEAVQLYETMNIHLVFMDIQMPNMSGFEATERIRAIKKDDKHVPIVALTARTVKGERERCLNCGMDDFITKPVILETIKKSILKFLTTPEKSKLKV